MVAVRLRTLLGPQCSFAARTVHQILRTPCSDARGSGAPHPQPRPDRSRADAVRRLPGAGGGAGGPGMGGKPANIARIHAPRSTLVPGKYAVSLVSLAW